MFFQETTRGNGTQQPPDGGGLATFATIVFMGLIVILVAVVCYKILTAPDVPVGSRSWLDYGNFFIVALGILAVLLAFLVTMLFSRRFFENPSQVLALLTALFGVIGTLVGTYFGVKAGSDAAQGAQNLASGATTTTGPEILSVQPSPGTSDIDRDTHPYATFSKPMNPDTLTELTFTIAERDTGTPVTGVNVTYEPLTRQATLTPSSDLAPNTAHRVTITTGARDQAGNAMAEAYTWDFTTGP
jgi:hypothetical protein